MRIIIDIVTRNDHGDKTLVSSKKYSGGTYTVDINLASVTRDTDLPAAVAHELARHFADELSWVHPGNPFVKPRRILPSDPGNALYFDVPVPGEHAGNPAGVPINGPVLDELKDAMAAVDAADVLRAYTVMFRRPIKQFGSTEILARSATDAVEAVRKKLDEPGNDLTFDSADDSDGIDWVHAEAGSETDPPDHAEWEEPKPSPGVLVAALNVIAGLSDAKGSMSPAVLELRLKRIADIAAKALADAVPSDA